MPPLNPMNLSHRGGLTPLGTRDHGWQALGPRMAPPSASVGGTGPSALTKALGMPRVTVQGSDSKWPQSVQLAQPDWDLLLPHRV